MTHRALFYGVMAVILFIGVTGREAFLNAANTPTPPALSPAL
jgi:hypothetical protein